MRESPTFVSIIKNEKTWKNLLDHCEGRRSSTCCGWFERYEGYYNSGISGSPKDLVAEIQAQDRAFCGILVEYSAEITKRTDPKAEDVVNCFKVREVKLGSNIPLSSLGFEDKTSFQHKNTLAPTSMANLLQLTPLRLWVETADYRTGHRSQYIDKRYYESISAIRTGERQVPMPMGTPKPTQNLHQYMNPLIPAFPRTRELSTEDGMAQFAWLNFRSGMLDPASPAEHSALLAFKELRLKIRAFEGCAGLLWGPNVERCDEAHVTICKSRVIRSPTHTPFVYVLQLIRSDLP
jgi:hypothetical protein